MAAQCLFLLLSDVGKGFSLVPSYAKYLNANICLVLTDVGLYFSISIMVHAV